MEAVGPAPARNIPTIEAGTALAWLLLTAIAASTILLRGWAPLNHDVAWIVEGAARILDGAVFGRDIVDVNPPLAWWLALGPAWLAAATELDAGQTTVLFVSGFALASLAAADRVLRFGGFATSFRGVMLAGPGAVLLLAPGYDFGQREHIMLIGALPYVLAVAARASGQPLPAGLSVLIGVFAAAGFWLKPHFLIIPMSLELWLAMQRRTLHTAIRLDTMALALCGMAYAAAIWLLAPDYLQTVVPDAATSYWAFRRDAFGLALATARELSLVIPLAFAACLLFRPLGPIQRALLIGAGAALIAALLQRKGWAYHLLPAAGLLSIASIAIVAQARPRWMRRFRVPAALLVTFASVVQPVAEVTFARDAAEADRLAALQTTFDAHAGPGGGVYAFITSPRDIHPAVLASNARWVSASCCLYSLPAALRAPHDAAAVAASERELSRILKELRADPPAVIVMDDRRLKLGLGGARFDYLPFLMQRPDFARVFAAYREAPRIEPFRIFLRSAADN